MKFFLSAIALLILLDCSKQEKGNSSARTDTAPAAPVGLPDSAGQSGRASRSPTQGTTWRYEKTIDATGNPVYKASLIASNVLQFAYPYTGGSTATLTIRRGDKRTHVYVEVSNGQFNRSFQNGSARVRFDGKPPVTYALSAAANGRANIVFFDAERGLIDRITASRRMVISVTFPGQRAQEIDLKTAGLRWNH